jgi:hypothetical protein
MFHEGTEFNTVKTELHWVSSIKQILQNFEFIITAYAKFLLGDHRHFDSVNFWGKFCT